MNQLLSIINFNNDILELMCLIKPIKNHWSIEFLRECSLLIDELKNVKTINKMIETKYVIIKLENNDKNYLFNSIQYIFSNTEKFKNQIAQYLNLQQSNIIFKIFNENIVNSPKDFYYMIAHLPFYKNIIELLIDFSQKKLGQIELSSIYGNDILNIFVSPEIQNWIFEKCHFISYYKYDVQLPNHFHLMINIKILHNIKNGKKYFYSITENIIDIVTSLLILYKVKNPYPLNLTYIDTPFKKKLCYFKKNLTINNFLISELEKISGLKYNFQQFTNPISSLNVNSGVTVKFYDNNDRNYITIWRREEFLKVLTHELIHYYSLEKGNSFNGKENQYIDSLNLSNNYPHYSKELFTELQTWSLYILIQLKNIDYRFTIKDLNFIFDYERFYSLINVCKIFKHYKINNFDQFISKNEFYMINANSSMLYYYLFKAFVLFDVDPVVESIIIPDHLCNQCKLKLTDYIQLKLKKNIGSNILKSYLNKILLSDKYFGDCLNMMAIQY